MRLVKSLTGRQDLPLWRSAKTGQETALRADRRFRAGTHTGVRAGTRTALPVMQPTQSYSIRGQCSSGQLTGKPAGTWPDYRDCWCAVSQLANLNTQLTDSDESTEFT
ncbi:UNVERIFIED_CONTAM: hypothetical protein FKN15_010000 [Acipenser sinensis]